MTDLVDAYQRDDIHAYESILQNNQDVLADQFIAENIDEVTRNMRTKAVLKLIAPYTRFTLSFIAKKLKFSESEVEDIVGFLIVDKKLKGKINQEQGTVEVENNKDSDRVQSLREWTSAIQSLWQTILNDGEGFKSDDSSQLLGGTASRSQISGKLDYNRMGGRGMNPFVSSRGGPRKRGGRGQMVGVQ